MGGEVYETLDDLLGDDEVDVVVNLTTQHAHVDVSGRCLEAGKHVYSEKPLAFTFQEAAALADRADANGLRLRAPQSRSWERRSRPLGARCDREPWAR